MYANSCGRCVLRGTEPAQHRSFLGILHLHLWFRRPKRIGEDFHTVTLKQTECRKKNRKIAAAVYLYQADNDGEWGELRFDFENGTAEIVRLADWDTVKSNVFAKAAIIYVQNQPTSILPKQVILALR